ncbi:MAG TPA: glycosyltransferase [Ilumatobacter sp.]
MRRSDGFAGSTRVLYLLTDEVSAVLVRGQLGFVHHEGFEVTAAARLADPGRPGAEWDRGVTVEHLPFVRQPSPGRDLLALWATIRLIRRVRPAIVNASTPKAGLLGMLAARLTRVPVRVYVVRGLRFETAAGWRRRVLRSLERVAVTAATHVVFNSASLLAVAERDGVIAPGRGEVIAAGSGNGVDAERFATAALPGHGDARRRLGVPAEATVIGFVGRFTHDKGIADLVDAVGSLRADRPGLHLLLVGQFEHGDPVAARVRAAIDPDHDHDHDHDPDHDHVTVVPWLDDTAVAYRAMDVLAFPSYREGLPNVPLEAQLCEVPVVGYAATGTVDAVDAGRTGVLVPTGDTGALAGALAELVDDAGRRRELGRQGPPWVLANFDRAALWRAWAERYRRWAAVAP